MKQRQRKNASKLPMKLDVRAPEAGAERAPAAQDGGNYWHFWALLLVLVAPLAGILAAPAGRVLGNPHCDNPSAYYFLNHFAAQCWRAGTVPLWNPHIMLGLPFVGDGEGSVFHPLSLLSVVLGTGVAINWLIAISFVLTGAFFYGYLRALKLGRPAAWCGAVTWSFSSAMISRIHAGHLNILLAFISMPLIMMLWERYRDGGGVRRLAGIALAYGLMMLAWYPQILYIFSLFFMIYVLLGSGLEVAGRRAAERAAAARGEGRAILKLGATVILGVGIAAIQLWPSLDFIGRSFRQEATLEFCGMFSFPPENLVTLIAPRFFGTANVMGPEIYWGRNAFWEMWIYLGVLPLLLAAAGAWAAPRRRRVVLLACAAIFLVLGLGNKTPLFPLIYRFVPLFDIFRGSSKNTLITLFCLVTLSAYGWEGIFGSRAEENQRRQMSIIAAVTGAALLIVAGVVAAVVLPGAEAAGSRLERFMNQIMASEERYFEPRAVTPELVRLAVRDAAGALARGAALLALSIAVILSARPARWRRFALPAAAVLMLADLLGIFMPLRQTFDENLTNLTLEVSPAAAQYPYPPRILNPNPWPNIAIKAGYSSPFGYAGNTLQRYNTLISLAQEQAPAQSRASSKFVKHTPHYKLLAFDAVALDRGQAPPQARTIGKLGERVLVPTGANERVPRAYLAAAPRYFERADDALAHVIAPGADVQRSPAIERPESEGKLEAAQLEAGETVRFISYAPARVELEVQARRPRELVLCDMAEPNWTARVNGEAAAIAPANYVYRAVRVPAGTSRVVFAYRPAAFYRGAVASAVSLGILVVMALWGLIRKKNHRE